MKIVSFIQVKGLCSYYCASYYSYLKNCGEAMCSDSDRPI